MAGELTKKQISVAKKDAISAIEKYKFDAREQLKEFRTISALVATAHRAYSDAGLQNEKKPSVKNEKKLARAYESYTYATDTYKKASAKLSGTQNLIEREYGKLIELSRMQGNFKAADRTGAEYEEYRESYARQLAKNDKSEGLYEIVKSQEAAEAEEPIDVAPTAELPAPTAEPLMPKSVTPTMTSVNVAPVTIDVTPIVERAISSAIEKLNEGLSRKLDAYINNLSIPAVEAPTAPVANANTQLDAGVLENVIAEECGVVEKMKSLCESISALIVELGALSAECKTIADKQKELGELQKQINDIQRHNVREQQGVQVNQRLVSEEQIELIAAQTLVAESQKELAQRQNAVAQAQKAAQEAEGQIADAISAVADTNAKILEKHQQLAASAEKQNAVLGELSERSRELLAEQRGALSASKKLIKEQQQLKTRAPQQKKKPADSSESVPRPEDSNAEA